MKAYKLIIIVVCALLLPVAVFAAYNDITLTTDVYIDTGSVSDINISNAEAEVESMTVGASTFSVDLVTGSSIEVTARSKNVMTTDAGSSYIDTNTCTDNGAVLKHSGAAGTVTITPDSTSTCGSTAGSSSSGGGGIVSSGGGGGGGSYSSSALTTPAPTQTQTQTATVAESAQTVKTVATATTASAPTSTSVSAVFSTKMSKGMSNSDIKRLQQLLNSDPDTMVASSGVGSAGNETNYYGSLTERAVQKFQAKYGVVSSGTPNTTGYGLVGPATRAKLSEVFGGDGAITTTTTTQETVATTATVSAGFTTPMFKGKSSSDIKRLQQLLNSDSDTMVASSGVGSAGNETNYYGNLTEKAVQKFQLKHGVVNSAGDAGYGYVGPKTRAKLNELFGE